MKRFESIADMLRNFLDLFIWKSLLQKLIEQWFLTEFHLNVKLLFLNPSSKVFDYMWWFSACLKGSQSINLLQNFIHVYVSYKISETYILR